MLKNIVISVLLMFLLTSCTSADQIMKTKTLEKEMSADLDAILAFWLKHGIDGGKGGFYGEIQNDGTPITDAKKSLVMNTRICWTFSAAYRLEKKAEYLHAAQVSYDYIQKYFYDSKYGGHYWLLDSNGAPVTDDKELYGLSFAIYGLSEYYLASGDKKALASAMELYTLIEQKAHDDQYTGYFESFKRDWEMMNKSTIAYGIDDGIKTMNTHLHMLESYTNLYKAGKDARVKKSLRELLDIHFKYIFDWNHDYCRLYFDQKWQSLNNTTSFGHDIEAAWLICDAAEALKDKKLIAQGRNCALKIADKVLERGIDTDGAILYEADQVKVTKANKDWWPQAENIVGFINAWQITGQEKYLDTAVNCWEFTKKNLVDHKYGGWYANPSNNKDADLKANAWKAPYHNGRSCMEIIKRLR